MTVELLSNVRAVLPDRIVEDATIAHESGQIVGIEEGRSYFGARDGHGCFCLPGLIDTHSDAIEREIMPRPKVMLEAEFALRLIEGRFSAAGVTTAFHGVSFDNRPEALTRSPEVVARLVDAVAQRRGERAPITHRLLYRVPARMSGSLDLALLAVQRAGVTDEPPLLSFEDHTPGQGQYTDVERFKEFVNASRLPLGTTVDEYVAAQMREAEACLPVRDAHVSRLAELAVEDKFRLLAHDCATVEDVLRAQSWGAAVAEFPTTLDAALTAREYGMPIVMGALNVLRGGSHAGNISGEELIQRGLCSSLASDYLPASLLAAVFNLVERKVVELPEAVRLVTAGPAEVAGMDGYGRIEPGFVADLVLVDIDGRWPAVRSIIRDEEISARAPQPMGELEPQSV